MYFYVFFIFIFNAKFQTIYGRRFKIEQKLFINFLSDCIQKMLRDVI